MKTTSYIERRLATWRDLPIDLISRSPIAHWAPVPLRLIVGYGFMSMASPSWPGASMLSPQFCRHLACPHRI
jgi:hypothetical protein